MKNQEIYNQLLPDHSTWLIRGQALRFNVPTQEEFKKLSFTQQDLYISKLRQAILEYRQSNPDLDQLIFKADSNITLLLINLKIALSYSTTPQNIDKLNSHSINSTNFHLYKKSIQELIAQTSIQSEIIDLHNQITKQYTVVIESINTLNQTLYPKPYLLQRIENIAHSIKTKIVNYL